LIFDLLKEKLAHLLGLFLSCKVCFIRPKTATAFSAS